MIIFSLTIAIKIKMILSPFFLPVYHRAAALIINNIGQKLEPEKSKLLLPIE